LGGLALLTAAGTHDDAARITPRPVGSRIRPQALSWPQGLNVPGAPQRKTWRARVYSACMTLEEWGQQPATHFARER